MSPRKTAAEIVAVEEYVSEYLALATGDLERCRSRILLISQYLNQRKRSRLGPVDEMEEETTRG